MIITNSILMSSCNHNFNNFGDPLADNYQGYETVNDPDSIKPVITDEVDYYQFLSSEIVDADYYKIEIATDSDFSDVVFLKTDYDTNQFIIDSDYKINTTMYWHVAAFKDDSWGGWSETASFQGPGIGDFFAGGYIIYLDGSGGGLVAASDDYKDAVPWGGYENLVGTTSTDFGTGNSNTYAIVNAFGMNEPYAGVSDYAARVCFDLETNGFNDWFLPSKDELNYIYENLYLNSISGFSDDLYWSSSESSDDLAHSYVWGQVFAHEGLQTQAGVKSDNWSVRAVRTF